MGQITSIEWTEATWNPVRGCSPVSPGCKNCYAERQSGRFCKPGEPFDGFVQIGKNGNAGPHWTGKVELVEKHLKDPLHWRKPQRVFVNSMSDLFHEGLLDSDIFKVFVVMGASQRHTFQVLTKRPARMLEWVRKVRSEGFPGWPLPNVWLGVSVEDQKTADERIPLLLQTPAAVRFVSYEPALGPVDFSAWLEGREEHGIDLSRPVGSRVGCCVGWTPPLDLVIVGGESGPGARPFDIQWARNTVAQCKAAGVACFVKQLGAKPYDGVEFGTGDPLGRPEGTESRGEDRKRFVKLRNRKGGDWSEWEPGLRVREFPEVHA